MTCVGVKFTGKTLPHEAYKVINKVKVYEVDNGEWIQGELIRHNGRCFIDEIEVRPETVGQVGHQRIKEEIKKGKRASEIKEYKW